MYFKDTVAAAKGKLMFKIQGSTAQLKQTLITIMVTSKETSVNF